MHTKTHGKYNPVIEHILKHMGNISMLQNAYYTAWQVQGCYRMHTITHGKYKDVIDCTLKHMVSISMLLVHYNISCYDEV